MTRPRPNVCRCLELADFSEQGMEPPRARLEMTEHGWDHVLDVNRKGSCYCAQAVDETMVGAGRPGLIINITSGAGFRGSSRGPLRGEQGRGPVIDPGMALELAPTASGSARARRGSP